MCSAAEDPMAFAAVCYSRYASLQCPNITMTANVEVQLRNYSNMFCGTCQVSDPLPGGAYMPDYAVGFDKQLSYLIADFYHQF
jgi:hypothetical protein